MPTLMRQGMLSVSLQEVSEPDFPLFFVEIFYDDYDDFSKGINVDRNYFLRKYSR